MTMTTPPPNPLDISLGSPPLATSCPEDQVIWDKAQDADAQDELRAAMDDALTIAEPADRPHPMTMFQDVYASMPSHLLDQWSEVTEDGSGTAEGAFPL